MVRVNTVSIGIFFLLSSLNSIGQDWKELKKANYEIKYPSTWELNESGMMGMSFAVFSPQKSAEDVFRENVNLIEQDLTGMNLDLDKYTEISTSQIKSMVVNANLRLNEREADHQKLIYDGDQGQFKLTFEQYYWVKNDKAYVLTFTAERSEFENYKDIAEQILKSFELNL